MLEIAFYVNLIALLTDSSTNRTLIFICDKKCMLNKNLKPMGFTLVELSIVLIISGVLTGKSLIESAKIRAQITQLEGYKSAYYTFKLKYDAVPGDMIDASSYFNGVADGNGDGRITPNADVAHSSAGVGREGRHLFAHLGAAGLIQGEYTDTFSIGSGFPATKIDPNKGLIAGGSICSTNPSYRQLSTEKATLLRVASIHLEIAKPDQNNSSYNDDAGVITVLQSYGIDNKIDDGNASSGLYQSYKTWENPTTTRCLDGVDGNYLLSESDNLQCMSMYVLEK